MQKFMTRKNCLLHKNQVTLKLLFEFFVRFWETKGYSVHFWKNQVTAESVDFTGFFRKSYRITHLHSGHHAIYKKIFL